MRILELPINYKKVEDTRKCQLAIINNTEFYNQWFYSLGGQ